MACISQPANRKDAANARRRRIMGFTQPARMAQASESSAADSQGHPGGQEGRHGARRSYGALLTMSLTAKPVPETSAATDESASTSTSFSPPTSEVSRRITSPVA